MQIYKAIQTAAAIALIIILLSVGFIVYKSGTNKRLIFSHRSEYHQIIHQLFDRKIVENQLVGEMTKEYSPTKVSAHDNYLTIQYYKTNEEQEDCCVYYSYYVHIIAKDNKLVKAFATEGLFAEIDHVFFNVLTESSEDEYWESRMNNVVASSNI